MSDLEAIIAGLDAFGTLGLLVWLVVSERNRATVAENRLVAHLESDVIEARDRAKNPTLQGE